LKNPAHDLSVANTKGKEKLIKTQKKEEDFLPKSSPELEI
jgi:hypothetical protein